MLGSDLREAVKKSFKRVKDHFEALEGEVRHNRDYIIKQNTSIEALNAKIKALEAKIQVLEASKLSFSDNKDNKNKDNIVSKSLKKAEISFKREDLLLKNEISSGNKGVSLDGYSLPGYSLPGYSLNIQELQENIPLILSRLSKQEFLTFLTIYQLEEENSKVTYDNVGGKLGITPGCVRTYVSGLIKKGLPIIKSKYNNRIFILSIPPEIRSLNIKKKLVNTFYSLDPSQKRLDDSF